MSWLRFSLRSYFQATKDDLCSIRRPGQARTHIVDRQVFYNLSCQPRLCIDDTNSRHRLPGTATYNFSWDRRYARDAWLRATYQGIAARREGDDQQSHNGDLQPGD